MWLSTYAFCSHKKARAGLHMTAETMRGLPMLASIQKADCMLQISHDNSLSELAQLCISPQWFKTYNGRLVCTDNKDTIMMLLTGRLSSIVTTHEPY